MNWFERLRKRKYDRPTTLIDISRMYVSTGQMGAYILKLRKSEEFKYCHMGYICRNDVNKGARFEIYAWNPNKFHVQYFKDRCPAMVEEEIYKLDGVSHSFISWGDNTEYGEVVLYGNPEYIAAKETYRNEKW